MYNVKIVNNPLKTVLLTGKLSERNSTLICRLCHDYIDIRTGNWNVAIRDISYSALNVPADFCEFVNVSTNLVTGKQIDSNQRLQNLEPPLARFEIKGGSKKLITFNEQWFSVNAQTDLLQLNFEFWPKHQNNLNIDLNATLLFYRFQ